MAKAKNVTATVVKLSNSATAKFENSKGSVLQVQLRKRSGKAPAGFRVSVVVRPAKTEAQPKPKSVRGMSTEHGTLASATDRFNALSAEAVTAGWTAKVVVKKETFSEMPKAIAA